VGPRMYVLGGGAHWRHLLNTIKLPMSGGDAACCQIVIIIIIVEVRRKFTTYIGIVVAEK